MLTGQVFITKTGKFLQQHLYVTDLFALLSGMLMPLAFAPVNCSLLAIIAPAIFLVILQNTTRRRALWRGGLFGFGMFIIGTSWVFISFYTFAAMPIWLAGVITVGFVSLLAACVAAQAWFFVRFFQQNTGVLLALAFASCWVLQELVRTYLFTGFPWLLLGYSQLITPLKGFAPIVSVYGLSFLTALIAALLIIAATAARKSAWLSALLIVVIVAAGALLAQIKWTTPVHDPVRVNLIQGNVLQKIKWQPGYLESILAHYKKVTEKNWNADLIVWPEGAVPDLLSHQQKYFQVLNIQAVQHHASLIVGTFLTDPTEQHYYNGLKVLGLSSGEYYKRHLVPYGEYMPFESLLSGLFTYFRIPMSMLTPGNNEQPLLRVQRNNIGAYLCYEVVYPMIVRSDLPDANLLLTATDDSWFGKSWAGVQMLQIAQMRSLETGREQMIIGNDSHTAIINAQGKIMAQTPNYQLAVLSSTVQPYEGATPWVALNPWWWFAALILLTGYLGVRHRI
jgi:apolipoprotein N-acyltransferase